MKSLATGMIRLDHTHVLTMFHRYKPDTDPKQKQGLAESICLALEVHAQLEEEIFYPAVAEAGVDIDIVGKNVPEHDDIRHHIEALRAMETVGPDYDRIVMDLMRVVMHHVADEETTVLPDAERLVPPERLSEIGRAMAKRRLELGGPKAGAMAGSMLRAASPTTKLLAGGALLAGGFMAGRALSRASHWGRPM